MWRANGLKGIRSQELGLCSVRHTPGRACVPGRQSMTIQFGMSLAARDLPAAIGRRPELVPQLTQMHANVQNMLRLHHTYADVESPAMDNAIKQLGMLEQLYQAGEVMARMTPPPS